jgi:hypothetical protein
MVKEMTHPADRTGLAPWAEICLVAAVLLAATWLMLWMAATHVG